MKYPFLYLLLCSLFFYFGCNSDSKLVKDAAKPVQQNPTPATKVAQPSYEGNVGFEVDEISAKAGQTACVDVLVSSFQNVISMQYTIAWDFEVLSFVNVQKFNLPYLGEQNFGTPLARNGKLTVVWIDNSLKGVNLEDNSPIYQICFEVIGKAGSKSPVVFTQSPTPFESVSAAEKLLKVETNNGSITIE